MFWEVNSLAQPLAPTRFSLLPANIPQRILLFEDDANDLRRLKGTILSIRPRIDLVDVGQFPDAFEQLHQHRFDAVLLSLRSGQSEFVKRLAEHTDAPIIVLTDL